MTVAAFTQQTAKKYHVFANGQQLGPVHLGHLHRMAGIGVLSRSDFVWTPGMEEWTAASNVDGLFPPSLFQANSGSSLGMAQSAAAKDERRSYISQYWSGDISLAKATLINCILIWVLYAALAYSVLAAMITAALPGAVLTLADFGIFAFGWFLYVWGIVGAWRSANQHLLQTGERAWAAVTKGFVAVTAMLQVTLYGGMVALLLISRVAT